VPGTNYYYRITTVDIHGNESIPSKEQSCVALPVQLNSFTASVINGRSVCLAWTTATETNNLGFEIERRRVSVPLSIGTNVLSTQWLKVGFVTGAGTSNIPKEYSFTDNDLLAGRYAYRLKQIDNDGSFKYSQSVEVEVSIPKVFMLSQNYPNPFNPTTTIEFTLAEDSKVSLKVYDMLGREVGTLVNKELKAGVLHQVTFDASRLSAGMYLYRLQAGNNVQVKKLILLK
jgi:hypothetical protein